MDRDKNVVLVSHDSLSDGPVPAGLTLDDLSRVRAEYRADTNRPGWRARSRKIEAQFLELNHALRGFRDFREVVLWCSPQISCQLLLIQMLAWFADQDLSGCRLSLVDSVYAGILPKEQLYAALKGRRKVTRAHLRLGQKAWAAFTADDPDMLNRLLRVDAPEIPPLAPALLTIAREYPAAGSGLSGMERMVLENLARRGPSRYTDLIVWASIDGGQSYPIGPSPDMLSGFLLRVSNQLVCFAEPFRGNCDNFEFNSALLEITEFGRKALAEEVDVVCFNGIERWIGGVHLEGQDCPWRWSEKAGKVVRKE